ncbi:MAG: ATP-binding protein [Nitrospirales bacterium]|nr:ATP-binding protein [Nitrospirales bacterium]
MDAPKIKNVVGGSISDVSGGVHIGDKIHYHPESSQLPRFLTVKIPSISPEKIVGRSDALEDLHQRLFDSKQVVLVNGLGGIGKTSLAQAYFGKYGEEYRHLAWVNQITNDLCGDFVNTEGLLESLQIESKGKDTQTLFSNIMIKLRNVTEHPGLLIIDNADESLAQWYDYLPHHFSWHILITSRKKIERFDLKELDLLSEDAAVELFLTHYTRGKISDKEIRGLVTAVDLHTLTIEILAKTAQLQRTELSRLKTAIEDDLKANVYIHHKGKKIERVTSYLCSIFSLTELSETDMWVLKQFASLPPEFHRYELLQDLIPVQTISEDKTLAELLRDLAGKGWLLENEETDSYKMHRIITDVLRKQQPITLEDTKELIDRITEKLSIDQTKDNPVEKFPWIPYGKILLAVFPSSNDAPISRLQNNLALVLQDLGEYAEARDLLEKAMRSDEKNFGPDHPTTAVSYSNLATVLQDLGEYAEALVLAERALQVFKDCLPAGHPHIEIVAQICEGIRRQMD